TPNLFSYLFGSILTVPQSDLIAMLILDIMILLVTYMFYERFLAVSFDEDYAEASGISVQYTYLTLLLLVALTVVILIRIVGIILIIAMLTIPATIAWQFSYKLKQIMIISFILSVIFTVEGLWLSYMLNLPSGATIVLVSVATLILSSALKRALRK
ncbi:metal ABC transporter permease, partial [Candidatus Bathyarchaeota archaeon]